MDKYPINLKKGDFIKFAFTVGVVQEDTVIKDGSSRVRIKYLHPLDNTVYRENWVWVLGSEECIVLKEG